MLVVPAFVDSRRYHSHDNHCRFIIYCDNFLSDGRTFYLKISTSMLRRFTWVLKLSRMKFAADICEVLGRGAFCPKYLEARLEIGSYYRYSSKYLHFLPAFLITAPGFSSGQTLFLILMP